MNAFARGVVAVLSLAGAGVAHGEVLSGEPIAADATAAVDGWLACRDVKPRTANCPALRAAAIETLATDLRTLGSGGNFGPLPLLVRVLAKSPEAELRAAAADGVGMIGPTAAETAALAAAFNDPVPAVRQSARLALSSSKDPAATVLAGRAVRAEQWKSFEPERAADLSKLKVPVYAGASLLRFASDVQQGTALFASADGPDAVVGFYAAKAKRRALSREEFVAAYGEKQAAEESGEEAGEDSEEENEFGVDEADLARAMAMMDVVNEQLDAGKSMEEAQQALVDQASASDVSADAYADEAVYDSPRFVVLEESDLSGKKKPMRYVVVFRDKTLGRTGIALHAPPALP